MKLRLKLNLSSIYDHVYEKLIKNKRKISPEIHSKFNKYFLEFYSHLKCFKNTFFGIYTKMC